MIGSGGGFRAMVGMSGVVKALADSKILDCVTFMGGLSGSSWYTWSYITILAMACTSACFLHVYKTFSSLHTVWRKVSGW